MRPALQPTVVQMATINSAEAKQAQKRCSPLLYEGEKVIVRIQPTFYEIKEKDVQESQYTNLDLEFRHIPVDIQEAALDYFNSEAFIKDVEGYVFLYVGASTIDCKDHLYPVYNLKVDAIKNSIANCILTVAICGTLYQPPFEEYKASVRNKEAKWVKIEPTRDDLIFAAKEGFWKTSNEGEIPIGKRKNPKSDVGQYLIGINRTEVEFIN